MIPFFDTSFIFDFFFNSSHYIPSLFPYSFVSVGYLLFSCLDHADFQGSWRSFIDCMHLFFFTKKASGPNLVFIFYLVFYALLDCTLFYDTHASGRPFVVFYYHHYYPHSFGICLPRNRYSFYSMGNSMEFFSILLDNHTIALLCRPPIVHCSLYPPPCRVTDMSTFNLKPGSPC